PGDTQPYSSPTTSLTRLSSRLLLAGGLCGFISTHPPGGNTHRRDNRRGAMITGLFFYAGVGVIAFLYAMVGHGGATGYLALLSMTAMSPAELSSTALCLNVVGAGAAFINFSRTIDGVRPLALPLLVGSIPCAFFGSLMPLNADTYSLLLAGVLF